MCTDSQANNAYIFPAVGHAAILTHCSSITDDVFVVAAEALSKMTTAENASQGRLFPPFAAIRNVSKVRRLAPYTATFCHVFRRLPVPLCECSLMLIVCPHIGVLFKAI